MIRRIASRLIKTAVAAPSSSARICPAPAASPSASRPPHAAAVHYARTISSSSSPLQGQADPNEQTTDITIVGGGVAGLALACALTAPSSPLAQSHTLTLIDAGNIVDKFVSPSNTGASPTTWPSLPTFENRTVSLSADNLAWIASSHVGLLHDEAGQSSLHLDRMRNIHAMSVSDGLTGATIEFGDSGEHGQTPGNPHLSIMVELSNLQQALLRTLHARAQSGSSADPKIRIMQGTKVQSIIPSPSRLGQQEGQDPDPWPLLSLASGSKTTQLRTRLLIGADGHFSPVRTYAGIRTFGHDYDQRGLVGTLNCRQGSVGHTAFQRFLPTGPIAFLPMSDSVASMVWTLPPELARALEAIQRDSNPELLAELINAAFRLPWHSIDYLFSRIRSFASSEASSSSEGRDWSWLSAAIDDRVRATLYRPAAEVEELGGVPDDELSASVGTGSGASSRAPPKVLSVESRSAASFPLKLRHAEAYTGASLRAGGGGAETTLDHFKPSRILEGLMGSIGLLQGAAGERASGSISADLTHPDADGHSSPPARSRTVLVGDAAHTIHPLAGQGLNQGLLDVRALARALERSVLEEGADIGLAKSLGHVSGGYERERWAANALWASGVDKLGGLFFGVGDGGRGYLAGANAGPNSGVVSGLVDRVAIWARSTGMEILNELGPVKERMTRGAGSPSHAYTRPSPPFQTRI
ncbi:putative ubiquinone biosynthesis monooxygenase [Tilletia horrida]|nr:putative ubiquinone biosynthesis monooxygenase [Tilletia horrida]